MTKYTANIAMDVRAYGSVSVTGDNPEEAKSKLTAKYVAENFEPHGSGNDIDYEHPSEIWAEYLWDEDAGQMMTDGFDVADGPWIIAEKDDAETIRQQMATAPNLADITEARIRSDERAKVMAELQRRPADMPLTSFDEQQALDVVWTAIEQWSEDCVGEDTPENIAEREQVCTAMAWIKEAIQ